MSVAFCLLNHTLTDNQCSELSESFRCTDIKYPPERVTSLWQAVPLDTCLLPEPLDLVIEWLKAESAVSGDYLIVQGEFGYTFAIVDYALQTGLIPLHAVTRRVAKEERQGEIVRRQYVFEHVCFRKYAYFNTIIPQTKSYRFLS